MRDKTSHERKRAGKSRDKQQERERERERERDEGRGIMQVRQGGIKRVSEGDDGVG